MKRLALFLDRDGVINVDHGYVHAPEDFQFIEGIFDLVAAANRTDYLVVVVTNQAGIGRGYYSEAQFHNLTHWMKGRFAAHGGKIDGVYFCPYHPEHGVGEYRRESEFRKPSPGMLLQAQSELGIDLEQSILIGDKLSDMAAGRSAGVGTLLHFCGEHVGDGTIAIRQLSDAMRYVCAHARQKGDCFKQSSVLDEAATRSKRKPPLPTTLQTWSRSATLGVFNDDGIAI